MRNSPLQSGAKGIVSGVVTSGATWIEQFEFCLNGREIDGADTSIWKFVFKSCDDGTPVLTLTSGSAITVTQNVIKTIFAINSAVSNMSGDYRADFSQQSADGTITHWLSGIVTFKNESLGF